jgi:hypothetical protein
MNGGVEASEDMETIDHISDMGSALDFAMSRMISPQRVSAQRS